MVTTNVRYLRTVLFILACLTTPGVANSDDTTQDKANPPQAPGAEVLAASGAGIKVPEGHTRPGRVVVAVLWFENKTGNRQADHWRYAIDRLLSDQLGHVKALRLRSVGIDFARRQLGIAKGSAIGPEQARKIGEIVEAQRVIWGSYTKKNDKWQVTARVLNVATGSPSDEMVAASDDWFNVLDPKQARCFRFRCDGGGRFFSGTTFACRPSGWLSLLAKLCFASSSPRFPHSRRSAIIAASVPRPQLSPLHQPGE